MMPSTRNDSPCIRKMLIELNVPRFEQVLFCRPLIMLKEPGKIRVFIWGAFLELTTSREGNKHHKIF